VLQSKKCCRVCLANYGIYTYDSSTNGDNLRANLAIVGANFSNNRTEWLPDDAVHMVPVGSAYGCANAYADFVANVFAYLFSEASAHKRPDLFTDLFADVVTDDAT
jgi:hypothetical protein